MIYDFVYFIISKYLKIYTDQLYIIHCNAWCLKVINANLYTINDQCNMFVVNVKQILNKKTTNKECLQAEDNMFCVLLKLKFDNYKTEVNLWLIANNFVYKLHLNETLNLAILHNQ